MIFNPHGNYSLQLENEVLIFKLNGGFNAEGVKLSSEEALHLVSSNNLNRWKILFILDEEALLVWDSIPDASGFIRNFVDRGCTDVSYVISNETQRMVVEKIFDSVDVRVSCFEMVEEAFSWLR